LCYFSVNLFKVLDIYEVFKGLETKHFYTFTEKKYGFNPKRLDRAIAKR
jgi:hypothetical protein